MAGPKGRGRSWAPLRAQTPQARELAEFLRNLIDEHDWTLRKLQNAIPYSRSTISDNLNGKVPPEPFVLAVVGAVIREPRRRERELARARDLWRAADRPPPRPAVDSTPPAKDGELTLVLETTGKALELAGRNAELERERAQSHHMVLLLVLLVGDLQKQVEHLKASPDAAQQLASLAEQLRQAEHELRRARQARDEAERLASRAKAESLSLQEKIAQMNGAMPAAEVLVADDLPAEFQEDYFLADVDRALRTAEEFLREGAERREELADGMEPPLPPQPPRAEVGHGVVGREWIGVALVTGRTLGCVLMMTGAAIYYAIHINVSGWAAGIALAFPTLLICAGTILLTDPWDIVGTLWPWLTDKGPLTWNFTARDITTRLMRLPWGVMAAAGTVLSITALQEWSTWFLVGTVPLALGAMGYAVLGENRAMVATLVELANSVRVVRGDDNGPGSRRATGG